MDRINKMNGASGTSDIEGKAATGSGERGGTRSSFNKRISEKFANSDSADSVHSFQNQLPNRRKVYVTEDFIPISAFLPLSSALVMSSEAETSLTIPLRT